MKGESPIDISEWIMKSLKTSSVEYRVYRFLVGTSQNLKYNMYGEKEEETLLFIMAESVECEELCQHAVELILLFVKRIADALANLNWEATKKTNTKLLNVLLRNMNCNNTNPILFNEVYEFAEHCKTPPKK